MNTSCRFSLKLLTVLLIAAFLTSGCWDRREIEERTSVVAIAIDKPKEHPDMVLLTVQIPIPIRIAGSSTGGGGADGKHSVEVMSAMGRTVVDAFENLQKRLNQELFYGHTRVIAIGEEVARSGLSQILDPFRRDPQIRRLLWPIVVKGEGRELLAAKPTLEQIPTVFIMTMIENGTRNGRIPEVNLGTFFVDLSSASREPYMNYVEVNGNDIKWSGVAIFRGDRMVGKLSERETWRMMRIRERRDGGNIVFPFEGNPKQLATINTEFVNSKKKVTFNGDQVIVRIYVSIESNLLEKTFEIDLFNPETIKQLEQDATAYLEKYTAELVHKLQHQYQTDAFGIGSYIKAHHNKQWKNMDWSKQYPEADIRVFYDVKLRNSGMGMR
ncbi:Ger(x)C family spore germination protein [Paenibacillus sp. GYB004]|uniref:Ger(x)C family spore germination protein n=1 Tax=Paenibacillus sp. GYB004 TaxID=2994393 RepID=UPI002F9619D7